MLLFDAIGKGINAAAQTAGAGGIAMPQRIRVGVVCLARKTYDFQAGKSTGNQERLRASNVE